MDVRAQARRGRTPPMLLCHSGVLIDDRIRTRGQATAEGVQLGIAHRSNDQQVKRGTNRRQSFFGPGAERQRSSLALPLGRPAVVSDRARLAAASRESNTLPLRGWRCRSARDPTRLSSRDG